MPRVCPVALAKLVCLVDPASMNKVEEQSRKISDINLRIPHIPAHIVSTHENIHNTFTASHTNTVLDSLLVMEAQVC